MPSKTSLLSPLSPVCHEVQLHRAENTCFAPSQEPFGAALKPVILETEKLPLFTGSKFTKTSLWMCTRKAGLALKPLDASAGNKPIRLFPRSSAVSECDNYTFSFPSQPSGDGRFSILSHTLSLRNFSLWLLMSPGDWERNQVAWDWRQRFILSRSHLQQRRWWHFANIVTIDPQRWYISTSEHRFHVSKWAVFNPCSTFFFSAILSGSKLRLSTLL